MGKTKNDEVPGNGGRARGHGRQGFSKRKQTGDIVLEVKSKGKPVASSSGAVEGKGHSRPAKQAAATPAVEAKIEKKVARDPKRDVENDEEYVIAMYRSQLASGARVWPDRPNYMYPGHWEYDGMSVEDWRRETRLVAMDPIVDAQIAAELVRTMPDSDPGGVLIQEPQADSLSEDMLGLTVGTLTWVDRAIASSSTEFEVPDVDAIYVYCGLFKDFTPSVTRQWREMVRFLSMTAPRYRELVLKRHRSSSLHTTLQVTACFSQLWAKCLEWMPLSQEELMHVERNASRDSLGTLFPGLCRLIAWMDILRNVEPVASSTFDSAVAGLYVSPLMSSQTHLDLVVWHCAMRWVNSGGCWPNSVEEEELAATLTASRAPVMVVPEPPGDVENLAVVVEAAPPACTAMIPVLSTGPLTSTACWIDHPDSAEIKLRNSWIGRWLVQLPAIKSKLRWLVARLSGLNVPGLIGLSGGLAVGWIITHFQQSILGRLLGWISLKLGVPESEKHLLMKFFYRYRVALLAFAAIRGLLKCLSNPVVMKTLTVTLSESDAPVARCTEHAGEVRSVGAERTACRRCGLLGKATIVSREERAWSVTTETVEDLYSPEVFNELISPSRTPATFDVASLPAFLVERVNAGRVADAFGLLRANAVAGLGYTQTLARAWWTDKFWRYAGLPIGTMLTPG